MGCIRRPLNLWSVVRAGRVVLAAAVGSAAAAAGPPVEVTLRSRPADALQARAEWSSAEEGGRELAVTVSNRSAGDVHLDEVVLRFPWAWPQEQGAQVSLGASTMFDLPALVRTLADPDLTSANYLLARAPGGTSQIVALTTWRKFRCMVELHDGWINVHVDGEGRRLGAGEDIPLERLWVDEDPHWHELLYRYADVLARVNQVRPKPAPQFIGWSNWDYYGSHFTAQQVLDNLEALAAMKVGANLLQVDGGWWDKCGDYNPRGDIPGGMEAIAAAVHARGMMAGIHFDGVRADVDSRVVREHPEYFLRDQDGDLLGGRRRADGRRGRVYFDFSHPGAREHLRRVMARVRGWGYQYFKVDFLKYALPEYQLRAEDREKDGTRVVGFDDRLTSVERLHLALEAMREGMGEDAWFLGCTAEFGTVIGRVDSLRSGGDIDPTYSRFSRSVMENGGMFYLHGKLFLNDADYHVARGSADEDQHLVKNPRKTGGAMPYGLAEMWTHYVGLFGGPKLSGDNLLILREERKDLFRRAVALPACERWLPVDFWQHGVNRDDPFRVFLGEAGGDVFLAIFNWNATAAAFHLDGLPEGTPARVQVRHGKVVFEPAAGTAVVRLDGHHSVVLQLPAGANFTELARTLRVDERPEVAVTEPSPRAP